MRYVNRTLCTIYKSKRRFSDIRSGGVWKAAYYLDNGATTQKPRQVVEAITDEYYSVNANVHRGVHFLSQQATELHEASS